MSIPILKCDKENNKIYDGICSFDFDGTVGKQTPAAADFCRKKNYAIYGLSAGGHQDCFNQFGYDRDGKTSGWDGDGIKSYDPDGKIKPNGVGLLGADFVGKGNGGNPKGHSIAQMISENRGNFKQNILDIPIIHFDDGEGCNKTDKGDENCDPTKHYAGRVNRDVLYYDYKKTTIPDKPYDKLNACIFQSGKNTIDGDIAKFAFENKGPNAWNEYKKNPNSADKRYPFLLCNQYATKWVQPKSLNVHSQAVRMGVGII